MQELLIVLQEKFKKGVNAAGAELLQVLFVSFD
jgi:hypothetical protein